MTSQDICGALVRQLDRGRVSMQLAYEGRFA